MLGGLAGDEGVVEGEMSMATLQGLVTNLVLQVSSLNTKVEDFSFENGLLARTVDLQQVRSTDYQIIKLTN